MTRRKISNELWAALEPSIPAFTPSPKGGRRRTVDERAALNGILYVLQKGIALEGWAGIAGWVSARMPGLPVSANCAFRFERRLDIHAALLCLAAAIICSRFVDDLC
jgi:transposase